MATTVSCKDSNIDNITPQQEEPIKDKTVDPKNTRRKEIEHTAKLDSIRLQKVLDGALEIAYQNIKAVDFNKEYKLTIDSTYSIFTKINISSTFSKEQRHLVIRNQSPMNIHYNIYLIENNSFKSVINHKLWVMEYINDSIIDINNDNYKDFIINGNGVNGCCLRSFTKVFINTPKNNSFTNNFRFLNPTFSSNEKIVRGVAYGHPGETELYKYAWKNNSIDTIEYVSYEVNNENVKTGNIIISNGKFYKDKYEIIDVLDQVPEEYQSIYGYDWFTGDILDN